MSPKPDSALLIVGHGSTVNPDSSAPTLEHAAAIRKLGVFGEVICCFWKEQPSMRDAEYMIESEDIYIVPNFISEGYFTQTVIPRELRLDGATTHRAGRTWKYCEPVGNHPRMTDLLLLRAREVAPAVPEEETTLLIVGHGTDLNDNSATAAKEQVRRIRELTKYAAVANAYMEEAPLISNWAEFSQTPNVVVVPFFISDGLHSYEDIPVLLGIESESTGAASRREIFRQNPYTLRGHTLYYASAIGTDPRFADVVLDQIALFDQSHPSGQPIHA